MRTGQHVEPEDATPALSSRGAPLLPALIAGALLCLGVACDESEDDPHATVDASDTADAAVIDWALSELTPLNVQDGRIVDGHGGTVILRGVGVNQLGDFFQGHPDIEPTLPLEKRDFELMEALGLNSVRLVVSWSALEPERGVYDEDYIARVRQAVDWARESRIYVIVDMHQDAWGKYIASPTDVECEAPRTPNVGWDGAPQWATLTDGLDTCILRTRELAPAVERAWQSFWEDRDGIQERFVAAWARLASEFRDDPVVVGYDILNEPNWGEDLDTCIRTHLPGMHRRALEAIRATEDAGHHKIIFFEPTALWSAYPQEEAVPFTDDPNIVYAPHIYNSLVELPFATNFQNAAAEAAVHGCPFWIGEWWGSDRQVAGVIAALEDRYQVGSARWLWKVSCGDPHFMAECWPDCEDHAYNGDRNSVFNIRCGDPEYPEGQEIGYHPTDEVILSRPYPRSFPSPATYVVDPDLRSIDIEGTSDGRVPLVLWIPGEGQPQVDSTGTDTPVLYDVPGGWILYTVPAAGEWHLQATGG